MSLTRQQIAQELLRRQRARASLLHFSQSIDLPGVPIKDPTDAEDPATGRLVNPIESTAHLFRPIETQIAQHHALIMKAIERTINTPRGRLMIFAPPGSAKSTYASVVAPAWAMGRTPGTQIILASYGTSIAAKQSRKVRAIVTDPLYTSLWEERPTLNEDQRAVDDWQLSNGSSMMAAGLLAGITGNRADGLIIDDPIANREQADSATIREKIHNEYIDTAMTRAKPKMWAIIIQTRWHEEDLAGTILPADYAGESGMIQCRDGQVWEVLCLQAKCEREDDPLGRRIGEYLWPEWFPETHWKTWESNPRASRTWGALYQQRPAPDAGIHFNAGMFRWYNASLPAQDQP
jgi:hypothetical protein